jgi:hypothetical protein
MSIYSNVIDIRDVISRYELLESELSENNFPVTRALVAEESVEDRRNEFTALSDILERLKDNGGDEQWRGEWYPLTLVADDYFTEYFKELTIECEYVPKDFPAWIKIDWERTAKDGLMDYTPITLDGRTYYYRAG